MLQVIISPAKQMQVARDGFAPRGIPPLSEKTAHVMDALRTIEREQGSEGLQALWGVNDKLLAENLERLHSYRDIADANFLGDAELSRLVSPAIFSYVGIQFRSMAPDVLDAAALEWLQGHLWVLSALYGCVRPRARSRAAAWFVGWRSVECIALRSLSVSMLGIRSTPIYPREMRKGRPLSS